MSLTYQLLKTEIDKISLKLIKKLKINDYEGKKFSLLLLKKLSGLKDSEIINFYTDGGGDHQIDGVYLDEETDLLRINIITCKFLSKLNDSIPDKDVTDLLNNGLSFLISGEERVGDFNSKIKLLKEDIDDLRKDYEEKVEYVIYFISSSKTPLSKNGKNAVDKFMNEAAKASISISYQEVNSDKLSALFSNRTIGSTSIPIKLSGKSYYQLVGRDGFICRLPVGEIIKIYKGFKEDGREYQGYYDFLFTDNVRKDLGLEKRINQKIFDTAVDPILASDFEYFNNGLTIIYEERTGTLSGDSPILFLKGLQVVNGCQTVSTLIKADTDKKLADDIYVTTKFIKRSQDDNFIQSVINFTNTQNAITDRDLHSNDQIQYDIQGIINNAGFYYERKLNEYKNEDSEKRVDALEAAQAYLCCELEEPHTAKQNKRKIFRELYKTVFDSNKSDLPYKFLISNKILEYSNGKRSENRLKKSKTKKKGKTPRYHYRDYVIANGSFHIAALLYKKLISKKDLPEIKKVISKLDALDIKLDSYYPNLIDRLENKLKKKQLKSVDLINYFKKNGLSGL